MRLRHNVLTCLICCALSGPNAQADSRPLDRVDVYALLATKVLDASAAQLVRHNGISFAPDEKELARLREAGAQNDLLESLKDPRLVRGGGLAKVPAQREQEEATVNNLERISTLVRTGRKKSWKEADRVCLTAMQVGLQDARLRYVHGYVLERQDRWKEAASEYREALRLDPQSAAAMARLGSVLEQTGRPSEALQQYRGAAGLEPGFAEAHLGIGSASFRLGFRHLSVTQAEYVEAKRLAPHEASVHAHLCILWQGLNDLKDAETACRRALECDPSSVEAHTAYGVVLGRQKRTMEAYREFQTALKLDPYSALAHFGLGGVFEAQDCTAEAGAEYRLAYRLNPFDPHIRENMRRKAVFFSTDEDNCSLSPGPPL